MIILMFAPSVTFGSFLSAPNRGSLFLTSYLYMESNARWLASAMLGPITLRLLGTDAHRFASAIGAF